MWKLAKRKLATDRNTVRSSTSDTDSEQNFGIDHFHSDVEQQPAITEPCQVEEANNHGTDTASDTDDIWGIINECNDDIIDSEVDEENENKAYSYIKEDIASWANRNLITHSALDDLLKILKRHGHDLPATARTLLQTPKNITMQIKSCMEYIYFPLQEEIIKFLGKYPSDVVSNINSIEISLNIDGLPIFKSTRKSVWPILCAIQLKPVTVFPVALTFGESKPGNLEFLHDTIKDLGALLQNGMQYNNRNIEVKLRCIVCDAPARAMVKAIKQYSGYYGCDRCNQKGVWLRKVTYQDTDNLTLRTDHTFRAQSQEEHHHAISPFCNLPIDM